MNTLQSLLRHLSENNVKLHVENNKIKYKDSNKTVQGEVLERLKEHKQEIIDLLNKSQLGDHSKMLGGFQSGDAIPVSQYQRSLLFSEQLTKAGEGNNLALSFRFDTAVDESKLYQAVRELFVSNDALRLGYQHHNGDWQATLNDHQANKIEVEKSSEEALIAQYGSLENCCINYIKEKFPFDGSPLAKAKIIQLGEHGYLLTIVVHHAVCDGISLSYLSQQLEQNYERKVGSLADVERASYLDYLVWQQKHADKKSVSYWQNKLAGIPDTIDLPFDMTRPNHMTFSGSTYKVALPETHNDRLAQLSKSLGVSQFNLLLAAFNVFLSRYCAQDDIVVGVPFANREQADTEQMIGLFINTLPIRVQHDSKATFTQLVSQVSDVLQEASIHQHSPLVEIIEAVNPIRSASYSPLFQVLVNYLDVPKEAVKSYFQKSVFELGEQNEQLAKYDLSLNIYKLGDKHELVFEYNNVLFFQKTVQRMAEQFTVLVGELLAAPTIAVNEHTMLTKLDEELINEINNTSSPLPSLKNPYLLVARTANLTPEKTALVFQNEEITFSQFNHRIEQIASYLVAAKVRKGDRVGLYFIRCVDMVCAMYACFRLGAVYVPLDPSYPNKRIAYICEDTQPNCILSLSALSSKLSALQTSSPIVYVDEPQDITVQELPEVEIGSSDTAYVIHTSGTTGNPKGVEVSHGNLQNLLVSLDDTFDKQAVQTWLAQTSISFDISIVELIWTLSRGKKVVLQQSKPADLVKLQGTQSTRPLTFSIMFFSADSNEQDKYQLMLESSQYADKNGFHAVWLPERHFGEFGGAFASPSVTCAALSTITKQIQLRAGSVVLPLHDPIRVAEEWSMIDNLSNGRVGLALASGWHPNDFVFQGSDYENRHQVLREKQTQLQDLWRGKPITRLNGLAKEHKITIRPTPKQAVLPTWITAAGNPETFRYAGEIGANILTHMLGQTLTQLRENIAIYHQELKKHGHQVIDKQVTLMLHTYLDSSKDLALSMTAKPFKSYIGSSVNLIAPLAQEVGMDMEKQKEQIIDIAFERLSETSALFGTADSCQELLHSVHEIGVTEIASLIDFGVATEHVMSSLEKLKQAQDKHVSHCQLVNLLQSAEYESELELIEKHAVTHVQMTPSQAKILYKQYEQGKYNLKVTDWLLGGEMLPSGLVKQLTGINQSRCHNMYGPTETTVWSAWQDVTDASVVIGKPIRNTQFVLLDERKKPVPVGMSGQLYIGGQGVSKGYWRKPELTAQSFTEISINGKLTGRYYSTGDLMRMTSEGFFEYLGRIDDQIKINGYRIEQKEIEKNITDLEGIKDCKVVVKRKSEGEAYLSAYVVKSELVVGDHAELSEDEEAKPYSFTDGSLIFHQSDHQLGGLYKEIFEDDIYFRHDIDLQAGDVILDVGANVGAFSIAAQQRQPQVQIYAFEPIPHTFSALKKNFEHRGINGRLFNCGISNKPETATFTYYQNMSGLSGRFANIESEQAAARAVIGEETSLLQGENKGDIEAYLEEVYKSQAVECRLDTISNVIRSENICQVDLLKIDIEKSECLALQGIEEQHWPLIKQIAMEVDGDEHLEFVTSTLKKYGFDVYIDDFIRANNDGDDPFNVYMLYAHNRRFKPASDGKRAHIKNYTEGEIKQALMSQLPEFMVPSEIIFIKHIPLLQNGKLDMSSLKQFTATHTHTEPGRQAVSEQEKKVAKIWNLVLKRTDSPVDKSFFELGGTSFDIVNLQQQMQAEFSIEISIIELFRHKTILEQSEFITSLLRQQAFKPEPQDKRMSKRKVVNKRRKNNIKVD